MTNALKSLVAYMTADADCSAITGGRIRGEQLRREDSRNMPQSCIVLKDAGGPGNPSEVTLERTRIDCFCYGATPDNAIKVRLKAYTALMAISRTAQSDVLLHCAQPVGGPHPMKDPDGNWPMIVETWMLLTDTVSLA